MSTSTSTLMFRGALTQTVARTTYLHVRLLAAPVDTRACVAGGVRSVHRPAQLDRAKLAAMGVERPTLERRLKLAPVEYVPPTDAA
jgi:hypothetical protein